MTNVNGNHIQVINISNQHFCPDFSTGKSITLEKYAKNGLEKELMFRQSIVEEKRKISALEAKPSDEWFLSAKARINKFCKSSSFLLNELVLLNAQSALITLRDKNALPSLINPTSDESFLFEFFWMMITFQLIFITLVK